VRGPNSFKEKKVTRFTFNNIEEEEGEMDRDNQSDGRFVPRSGP
jgi:hypothetical protein